MANLSTLPTTEANEDSRGGVHTIEWEDHELKVTVSKLREQSNGDLRADFDLALQPAVKVSTLRKQDRAGVPEKDWRKVEESPGFKYFARFNLKSGQTKASTSRDMEKVAPPQLGAEVGVWRYIIERVCNYVRVAFNKGEAGIQLIDSTASETTEFRLWPYLQERQPTILFGGGDSGKSYFALLAGFLIATGREHLGMKPQQGNVAYLDYENGEGTIKGRLSRVAAGFGETTPLRSSTTCR